MAAPGSSSRGGGAVKRPLQGEEEGDQEETLHAAKRPAGAGESPGRRLIGLSVRPLNGSFGALVGRDPPLTAADLRDEGLGAELKAIWHRHGILVLRGLEKLTPEDLVVFSSHFGEVEQELSGGRAHAKLPGVPVMRLGNVRDAEGNLISVPSSSAARLPPDGSCQYRPTERLPVWHTDGCHRRRAPAGSAFFCRRAPAEGAETCFADMAAAWEGLSEEEQRRLEGLECVCSLAHHDKKLQRRKPDYPTLTAEQRAANPPRRVPVALAHPATGRKAIYGLGSSTCCVVPWGAAVEAERMDSYDLEGVEDESVSILRDLLPRFTAPSLTVVWRWREGDLVVWDNRSTLHCGTGYDESKYVREMWRTTILPHEPAAAAAAAAAASGSG